jgi:hypothetical protein
MFTSINTFHNSTDNVVLFLVSRIVLYLESVCQMITKYMTDCLDNLTGSQVGRKQ